MYVFFNLRRNWCTRISRDYRNFFNPKKGNYLRTISCNALNNDLKLIIDTRLKFLTKNVIFSVKIIPRLFLIRIFDF